MKNPKHDPTQMAAFIKAANEAEADDDEAKFNAILKKIAEEASETLLAAKDGDKLHIVRETADLWFHCLVMLAFHGLGPEDVLAELRRREGISGIEEKNSRK